MPHVRRRSRNSCRPTSAPRVASCAGSAAPRSSPSASASAAAIPGSQPRRTTACRRSRLLREARRAQRRPGPAQRAADLKGPILALQAGDDQNITPESNAAFDAGADARGRRARARRHEGAPHSFFDRKQEEFADASDDAWRPRARVHRAAPLGHSDRFGTRGKQTERRSRSRRAGKRRARSLAAYYTSRRAGRRSSAG